MKIMQYRVVIRSEGEEHGFEPQTKMDCENRAKYIREHDLTPESVTEDVWVEKREVKYLPWERCEALS